MSLIKERIKEIAVNKGIPYGKFFKDLDLAPSGFTGEKIKKGTNSETIQKIVAMFPDIDLHWLITGEKKTVKSRGVDIVNEDQAEYGKNNEAELLEVLRENRLLNNENRELKKQLARYKKSDSQVSN